MPDPSDLHVTVAGEAIPLRLHRNPRARRVTLRADAVKREVRLVLPVRASLNEALRFVAQQQGWIAARFVSAPGAVPVVSGTTIALAGEALEIHWAPANPRSPQIHEGMLRIGGAEESVGPRVLRFLKARARDAMTADLSDYVARARVEMPKLALSDPRGRWGSCSSRGVIRLSWRLVMAPDWVRRSVVAHEVAHLKHMNHSPQFYALLDDIYERDRGDADRWLKAHGIGLQMIGR